jgi:hypothetical protein
MMRAVSKCLEAAGDSQARHMHPGWAAAAARRQLQVIVTGDVLAVCVALPTLVAHWAESCQRSTACAPAIVGCVAQHT